MVYEGDSLGLLEGLTQHWIQRLYPSADYVLELDQPAFHFVRPFRPSFDKNYSRVFFESSFSLVARISLNPLLTVD